jgi:CRISPR/Cas system-associated endonuclease Cas1
MSDSGVQKLLRGYEERLSTRVRHAESGERTTYRRCLELQVRQIANIVLDKKRAYVPVTIK